ncbi:amino acid adenylation domain-containing protein [Cytobacillus pseudoceanisediminis]|uniref:Amino acid adenylation domain-containing protein n=1 Tax=Cytobacillus pseudoceanisediminis TaxID=3051614 RepID=A0ABZ2ZS06_9BACI
MAQHSIQKTQKACNFVEILRMRAINQPNDIAYEFMINGMETTNSLTYAELDRQARLIGRLLQNIGASGERVLLLYSPGLEYIAAYFGCLYAGSVAVPAYPPSSKRLIPRLLAIAENSGAMVALTSKNLLDKMEKNYEKFPELTNLVWEATDSLSYALEKEWQEPFLTSDSLAFLQYTSGSTSAPKGVMVTHGNLIHNSKLIQNAFEQGPNDRGVIWLPPYHDMGLIGGILQPLFSGYPVTLMSPFDFMQQPIKWLEVISNTGATTSGGPNFAFDLCVKKITEEQKKSLDLSKWKVAFNGAEPIRAETLKRFAKEFSSCGFKEEAFYPCYGLAEGTLLVSGGEVKSLPTSVKFDTGKIEAMHAVEVQETLGVNSHSLIGCGKSILEQKICVVDPVTLRECPNGRMGEIWVKGPSVAKGYWNMPEKSKETFSARLQDTGEGPFLRTGDIGFWHKGELFVTGRIKDLIIIRGRNLYPQDIELTVERSYPAARPNSGAAFSVTVEDEEKLVVVQEVERTYRNLDPDKMINSITHAIIREYGVHPYAVALLKFGGVPKTSSGKIQRSIARELFLKGELNEIAIRIPSEEDSELRPIERVVMKVDNIRELPFDQRVVVVEDTLMSLLSHASGLTLSAKDIHTSVSDLGVDSMKAFEIQHSLEENWGILVSAVSFLQDMTIAQIRDLVLSKLNENELPIEIEKEGHTGGMAATKGQKGIYFHHNFAKESTAYHLARAVRITGALDANKINPIINTIVGRHEALRTTFTQNNEKELQQIISGESRFEYYYETDESLSNEEVISLIQNETQRPFNLEEGPLMRVLIIRRSKEEYLMLWVFHHIIVDLWSIDVLLSEFISLLQAEDKHPSILEQNPMQFSDFSKWQKSWVNDPKGEQHLRYWSKILEGDLPVLNLPTDYPRPALQTYQGASSTIKLNKKLINRLKELSQKYGTTLYMTLLTGYAILLNRYTGQDELIIGSPMAGRTRAEMSKLVGYITNTIPLRFKFSQDELTGDFLRQVRKQVLQSFEHQDYPFDLMLEKINLKRDPSRSPIYQTVFVMQNVGSREMGAIAAGQTGSIATWGNLNIDALPLAETSALFDLTMTVAETETGLVATMQYNNDLFSAETVNRMLQHFTQLLYSITENEQQLVGRLSMMNEQEKSELISFNKKETNQERKNLLELFEAQVLRTPFAVAVSYENLKITYEELNERTNQLARYLQKRGIQTGDKVGICVDRSLEMIVGILGILKAGAAYVPLDPAYPENRLQFIMKDSATSCLITQNHLIEKFQDQLGGSIYLIDKEWDEISKENKSALNISLPPDSLAYIIYTSGSTGLPKGVLVSHHNVVRLFESTEHWFHFDQNDVWTMFHSYAFDFSVWEIWGPLLKGGKLVIVPYWVSRNTEEFYKLLHREKVTVLNQTPSAFKQLIHVEESLNERLPLSLRYIIFGGETLLVQSLIPWIERHGDDNPKLINMYGITETTVHVTYRRITKEDMERQNSLIGEPIPDLQVYVLDKYFQPVPLGIPGEMYVGGSGVTKGYLNRLDLTEERFIINPFYSNTEEIIYRTGDLARRLANGELEYIGRIDNQVKIRGHRIELGEIEAVLTQMEEIREVVVLSNKDHLDQIALTAYVVPQDFDKRLHIQQIKSSLKRKIPEFMVPAYFVVIDSLPLNQNGKIDKNALPKPTVENFHLSSSSVSLPSSKIEKKLASIWEEVLGINNINITDNYFDIGGDSIRSLRVITLAKEQGLVFTLQDLYLHSTIKELANHLKLTMSKEVLEHVTEPFDLVSSEDLALIPDDIQDAYPLTSLQAGLVFHSEYSQDYKNYISTFRLRVHFNEDLLNKALQRLSDRHPMLRTSFEIGKYSTPLQLVYKQVNPELLVTDWRELDEKKQKELFEEFLETQKSEKFNWSKAPLLRFNVHCLTDDIFQFTLTEPFLDGWSVASLITELFKDYLDLLENPNILAKSGPKSTFRDYVAKERKVLQDESNIEFWEKELGDCTPNLLPRWGRNQTKAQLKKDRLWVKIPKEVSNGLQMMAKETSIPLKNILLGAHLRVVSMLSGQTDVLTGIFENGRLEQHQGEQVLGLFLNTLPFRAQLKSKGTWIELAQQSFDKERTLLPYRRYPLAELQRRFGGRKQLFETAFNFTHFHVYEGLTELEGLEVLDAEHTDYTFITLTAQFTVDINSENIRLGLDYNPQELDREQMDYIASYYRNVLSEMAKNPLGKYNQVPLLADKELKQILFEWNNTAEGEEDEYECIHELFERQANNFPERIAVKDGERSLSYREVNAQANQLARRLQHMGAGPDKLVGITLERSTELVIGLLAVLKSGAAYVPLDPEYPNERLEFMFEDSQLEILLTSESLINKLPALHVPILFMDREREEISKECISNLELQLSPKRLAYVIYTSGSTGKPKGVQVQHCGVVNLLQSMQKEPGIDSDDILVAVTSISFDIAALEIFLPLITGAVLVIGKNEVVRDSMHLAEFIKRENATIMQATPATWNMLVNAGWKNKNGLKILCGGEPLQHDLAKKLLEGGNLVWNLYGPTETTIWSTLHPITKADTPILIGKPIRNTRVYLLDSFDQQVPIGVIGELCIGGHGVSMGYRNRPALTKEKFIFDPYNDSQAEKVYRTGDLARFLPDGTIECLGRIDNQVKVRGFRIELGEIETLLAQHNNIKQVVVIARPDGFGENQLVAYLIPEEEREINVANIRKYLKERLPDYMVPSIYVSMEQFPLLPNGKLNRNGLPEPMPEAIKLEDDWEKPQTEIEEEVARIWGELLGLPRIGRDYDFYELGGHSLLATQLISRLRGVFGVELSLRNLLQGSTVAKMSQEIEFQLTQKKDEDLTELLELIDKLSEEEAMKLLIEKGGLK